MVLPTVTRLLNILSFKLFTKLLFIAIGCFSFETGSLPLEASSSLDVIFFLVFVYFLHVICVYPLPFLHLRPLFERVYHNIIQRLYASLIFDINAHIYWFLLMDFEFVLSFIAIG